MCGIVAAVANENVVSALVEGLRRLEYRGYDSCGLAVVNDVDKVFKRVRTLDGVQNLSDQVVEQKVVAQLGIAHTRWATHGAPNADNAHPHFSSPLKQNEPRIAVVHNGIIENYAELKRTLQSQGYHFDSETDTEVIVNLVASQYQGDLLQAVLSAKTQLKGAYAIACICEDEPNRLVAARSGSMMVLAKNTHGYYIASDELAIVGHCQQAMFLDEGDVVDATIGEVRVLDQQGQIKQLEWKPVALHPLAADLGGYRHFMQKEIFEQPRAVADTLSGLMRIGPELFGEQERVREIFEDTQQILILACGTSYYAGLVAKYWIEAMANLPVNVEIASEYRYRKSVVNPKTLVVVVSQSGETADTLAALEHAKSLGMNKTLAVCNVSTSAMVRACKLQFITRAGVEIGVASTKAFTTQLTALFLLALVFAQLRGEMTEALLEEHLTHLRHLPSAISSVLSLEPAIMSWSEQFVPLENALFLGRGAHYPIALEGALKLKEISYIHAEGYPAGELKHGPLALVTDAMPVVTVAPNDELLGKLKSNIQEVKARGGQLYVFADVDARIESEDGIQVIRMPEHYGMLSPVLHSVALQLLAYHTACARGTDVDKPRNLAKSVTVE